MTDDKVTLTTHMARAQADMYIEMKDRAEAAEKEVAGWKAAYDRQAVLMGKYAREAMAAEAKLTALVERLDQIVSIAAEGARKPSNIDHLRKTIMAMSSTAAVAKALAHHSAPVGEADVETIKRYHIRSNVASLPDTYLEVSAPPTTPTSAPVEDVGGLMLALVIADQQVTAMRSQMYRAADMIEAADKTRAKINASNVRAWVTPTIEDANRRDILAALSPSLIQPAPVCVMCGAVNADPRPWDPREAVCPDCQDRRGPRPIQPQGEERS